MDKAGYQVGTLGLWGGVGALWACVGWSAVLLFAIWRLAAIALEALDFEWTAWHWAAAVINTLFMAWSEGYRGFQMSFSPRTASRVHYVAYHPSPLRTALAPLFAVGYFDAGRRTLSIAWLGTVAIVLLILLVHQLPQPWRGIIDMGVVLGLTWGVISFWSCLVRLFAGDAVDRSPDVPGASLEEAK